MKIPKDNLSRLQSSKNETKVIELKSKPGHRVVSPAEQKLILSFFSLFPALIGSNLLSKLPSIGKSLGLTTLLGIPLVPWFLKLKPYEVAEGPHGPVGP